MYNGCKWDDSEQVPTFADASKNEKVYNHFTSFEFTYENFKQDYKLSILKTFRNQINRHVWSLNLDYVLRMSFLCAVSHAQNL